MRAARAALVLLLFVALGASKAQERQPETSSADAPVERQVLVMLRAAPPHFRPDAAYAGAYDRGGGRVARQRIAEGLASQYGLTMVDAWPMPALGVDCFVMQASREGSLEQLVERLSADPRVEWVQSMHVFQVLAHSDPLYPLQPGARALHLDELHRVATGKRVSVAIIDTGVEADHPDLLGRVAVTRDLVGVPGRVAEMHGTAVAGIIGARANDGVGIAGVAPDAKLVVLRACWQRDARNGAAVCSTFTLAKALQFALDERVDVVNLSIGGPRDPLLERLLDVASARGMIVVSAVDPARGASSFPASHRFVLAVDEVDGQDTPAAVLLAPGRDVPVPVPGRQWGFVSGSSFAAAHVAGLAALLRELAPNVQTRQVRDALTPKAAASLAAPRRPVVDACAAIAAIGGTCACSCEIAGDTRSRPTP